MQQPKTNFIQEMRKKLNSYHIQKLRKIQEGQKDKEHFKQENKAKDALIEFDDTFLEEDEPSQFEQITGWNSTRPVVVQQGQNYMDRRSLPSRKNVISVPSKTLGFQFQKRERNPDMINYLKSLLTRLQSPVAPRRSLKTQNLKKKDENVKIKMNQRINEMKKSKVDLLKNKNNQRTSFIYKQPKQQKTKFQIIDLNTENNPFTTQTIRAVSQYQKIKRKNHNQYQIDIAREKDILQQLIRGNSAQKNCLQKGPKSTQKFTLKNLLC